MPSPRNVIVLIVVVAALAPTLAAAGVGKAVARGAVRAMNRQSSKVASRLFSFRSVVRPRSAAYGRKPPLPKSMMIARDTHRPATKLSSDRTVFRYTTAARARSEASRGIPANRHMTATSGPGRPLSAVNAQKRYGLPQRPVVRNTVRVPKGTTVQFGRVKSGKPGLGEIFTRERLPKESITKTVRLK